MSTTREPKETLLDRFAMAAMTGLIMRGPDKAANLSHRAYQVAEAMMDERRDRLTVVVPTADTCDNCSHLITHCAENWTLNKGHLRFCSESCQIEFIQDMQAA